MIIEIKDKCLKARQGKYVVYDVDYLLSHLAREIALLWNSQHRVIEINKTGHWLKRARGYKCSRCLTVHSHTSIFCPSCGAKMVEPQERSDKE